MAESNSPVELLSERVREEVDRVSTQGLWTPRDEARLDEAFEVAARAALRVPSFVERSVLIRTALKRVVPARFRPALRGLGRYFENALRGIHGRLGGAR